MSGIPPHKDTCPVPCNLKIEEIKKWINKTLDVLHDTIVDTSDESKEWYEMFMDEIDTLQYNIKDI